MQIRVLDRKAIVRIESIRRGVFAEQGWVRVTEGRVGPLAYRCSCHAPCGYRAFPGVKKLRDLQWSDVMKCWRRALKAVGTLPGGPDSIEVWEKEVSRLQIENRRMRGAGLITRMPPVMLLAVLPGLVIRALGHDFPQEFSPTVGARSEDINKHLEATRAEVYMNFEWGRPMGAGLPKGTEGVIL